MAGALRRANRSGWCRLMCSIQPRRSSSGPASRATPSTSWTGSARSRRSSLVRCLNSSRSSSGNDSDAIWLSWVIDARGATSAGSAAAAGFGIWPLAMSRSRASTSSVKPVSSTSIHVLSRSPSTGDARSTLPSIAMTSPFGSSSPSVTLAPGSAANGTFIDSNLPRRSLRVVNTWT